LGLSGRFYNAFSITIIVAFFGRESMAQVECREVADYPIHLKFRSDTSLTTNSNLSTTLKLLKVSTIQDIELEQNHF